MNHPFAAQPLLGTPFSDTATRVLLCGAGELGREVAIELKRLGCEVIAVDRYAHAPAMQVADRSHVVNMLDGDALRAVIEQEQPSLIVPEIEAIATDELVALEQQGFCVVPTARATQLTMNREGIRRLAAEQLNLPTSPYQFAGDWSEFVGAAEAIGFPCVVKPVMSSSGKGQSLMRSANELESAWQYAQEGGRAGGGRVIVEGFVAFDFEITLLTVRSLDANGDVQTQFCAPIGHRQENGDYQESWQPQAMSAAALQQSQWVADKITAALGGLGLFGVELFVCGDEVIFSEVSPRPHDTGMVTLISQNLSEFALHARAILGLPIAEIELLGASASAVLLPQADSKQLQYVGLRQALAQPGTDLRLFGKPEIHGRRRMGVALAKADTVDAARSKAKAVIAAIETR